MRNPITDPMARQYWRDYQTLCRTGNPLGLSFVEYVAHRVLELAPQSVSAADASPWYVATCGHHHPWGESCGTWTASA